MYVVLNKYAHKSIQPMLEPFWLLEMKQALNWAGKKLLEEILKIKQRFWRKCHHLMSPGHFIVCTLGFLTEEKERSLNRIAPPSVLNMSIFHGGKEQKKKKIRGRKTRSGIYWPRTMSKSLYIFYIFCLTKSLLLCEVSILIRTYRRGKQTAVHWQ